MKPNAFTVDVEDYFQVAAFTDVISTSEWPQLESRVERNIDLLLQLLDDTKTSGTFFTLGWIAERHPKMIRRIAQAGHEIASHGYAHAKANGQNPAELREDVSRSRKILEDVAGVNVIGYRAPSFSIDESNLWVHEVLQDCGYEYSSSVYPIQHDHYGMPDAPRFAYKTNCGLTEIPATSVRIGKRNFPASGGGFFRLLPYSMSKWAIERVNNRDDESAVFYCHPWEFDPSQPRITEARLSSQFRHYVNIAKTSARVRSLLKDFQWDRMDKVFKTVLEDAKVVCG